MSVSENLHTFGHGAGQTTVPLPLQHGEREVLRVHATSSPRGLGPVGGQLALTTHRVAFLPWSTADVRRVAAWALPQQPIHDLCPDGTALSVDAGDPPSVSSGPTVVVNDADGSRHVFAVLAGIWSPNESPSNAAVRDRFVTAAKLNWTRRPQPAFA